MSNDTIHDTAAEHSTTEYTVPLIDQDTGDGWDVDVEADSPTDAVQAALEEANGEVFVAKTFLDQHWDGLGGGRA